ncbi:O-antigen chain length regulator [Stutzerimonas stutzeri]|uniref:LPS O-antigen chain length determinant protein WzzB n=1 Tax=Stutzerimonas stutzeri TaxID=316 RepID=UPI0024A31CEC|nr:Wzz/FepE/Etk N-terminal domain-containing protein [Stutzerimonas stutzeri]GLZ23973.1 O-antigen chain length regulator [Stutzerimonas stutzeri]
MKEVNVAPAGTDEIDLIELARALWAQRWVIALCTAVVTSLAGLYALLSPSVYEASVSVIPPTFSQVAELNEGRSKASQDSASDVDRVYQAFARRLGSDELKQDFFDRFYLPDMTSNPDDQVRLYRNFSSSLSMKTDKNQPQRYYLSFSDGDVRKASRWLEQYIQLAGTYAKEELLADARQVIDSRKSLLRSQIAVMKRTAEVRRADRLMQLQEALAVAEAVGIVDPPAISGATTTPLQGDLLYMRGSRALNAEMETLQARSSNEPFISELRALEEELSVFDEVRLNEADFSVFRFDGAVKALPDAVSPKRGMILALGLVLGGMLGIFIALLRSLWSRRPETCGAQPTSPCSAEPRVCLASDRACRRAAV